jgi:hypothetical protein
VNWTRLQIIAEGPTEEAFVKSSIVPHLANFSMSTSVSVVYSNRQLGMRGGISNFEKIKKDLILRIKEDHAPETRFTTMIDFYALPTNFPGWNETKRKNDPLEKVRILENAFREKIGDSRFIPYIQLHEFEALLYCDLSELDKRIPDSHAGIEALKKETATMPPETINDGATTAPSKRIIAHIPIYKHSKVRVGAVAASAIGLPTIRARCPHFDEWLTCLESQGHALCG